MRRSDSLQARLRRTAGDRRGISSPFAARALVWAIAICLSATLAMADGDGPELPPVFDSGVDGGPGDPGTGPYLPLSSVPQLSSRPSAPQKIYLDFVGDDTFNWSIYSPNHVQAFNTDADPLTFNPFETASMQQIWARVAEKYSPFNIDVTTINPGASHFVANDSIKVVVGGAGGWVGERVGGVAFVNSYSNGDTSVANTAYVFPKNLAGGYAPYVAEAISHEAGHTFGLVHQSTYSGVTKTAEYSFGTYPGTGSGTGYTSPIMGESYFAQRGVWSNSTSSAQNPDGSPILQDDVSILSSATNGFGYRPDDHGNTIATADPLLFNGGVVSSAGVIETTADKDYFSFHSTGGEATLNIKAARWDGQVIGMLDTKAELFSSNGTLVASSSNFFSTSYPSLDETITVNLAPGDYDLAVESQGNYGDVGQYTIDGFVPVPEPGTLLLLGIGTLGLGAYRRRHGACRR